LSQPNSLTELQEALNWAKGRGVPLTVIGAGTNLLVSDQGVPGLVITLRQLQGSTWGEAGQIKAAAGEPLARLAWQSARRGWHGLEWAVGIPGSAGGAVVMNAGAHGWETAQVVTGVEILDSQGSLHYLTAPELKFSYRHSCLQAQPNIVVAVYFKLETAKESLLPLEKAEQYNRHRRQTQPQGYPNCGSVFRNPQTRPSGWLLERCGLKGYAIGGAQVAQEHANFILNRHQAQAADIHALMRHMQDTVQAHWGITLESEVKILGEFSKVPTCAQPLN